jgi:alpha/beta superfamily hydrolase
MSVERVQIPGPAGTLEGIVEQPSDQRAGEPATVAVICHPHPQYGGTMTNKVVHMLAKSCNELGATAVRFNYRGVGASAGSYDEGNGETLDALAAIEWAQARWSGTQLWLGGFSFGGAVAIRAAAQVPVQRLMTVAPAIQRVAVDIAQRPHSAWLIVQGDSDELVDAKQIQEWAATLDPPPELVMLPGVDHFFHGRLNDLRDIVLRWVRGSQGGARE